MVEKGFRNPTENSMDEMAEAGRAGSLVGVYLWKRSANM
jgi:hypothetical protein